LRPESRSTAGGKRCAPDLHAGGIAAILVRSHDQGDTSLNDSATSTAATPELYWEDFPVGQVREFGHKVVERDETIAFAKQFDPQPFHLSDEAAEASLFGRLSASGWHTCAMAMRMMCDDYLLRSSSLGSPGMDELKWHRPVFPGDTLRVKLTVIESRPMNSRPDVGLMRARWEVLNQDDVAVMSMVGWGMFGRRP
jgi:acyl dehydratase